MHKCNGKPKHESTNKTYILDQKVTSLNVHPHISLKKKNVEQPLKLKKNNLMKRIWIKLLQL